MVPIDIDPESGCRLPLPKRDELDADAQRIYDSLAEPGSGSLRGLKGPGGIMLHSPELAILVTARALDSQFEWCAHEAEALRQGIEAQIIDIIKYRKDAAALDEADRAVIELGREIFTSKKVMPASRQALAKRAFSERNP